MEAKSYTKIVLAVTSVTLAIFAVTFAATIGPMFMYGGPGLFGMNNIEPGSEEEERILDDIGALSSVRTFKEVFPEYREDHENNRHAVMYFIQARNGNTGNVYSLHVQHQAYNGQVEEYTNCRLIDTGVNDNSVRFPHFGPFDQKNLFLDSTIRDSNCLDDDYYEKYPVLVRDELQ